MTEFQQARRKVVVSTTLASAFLIALAIIAAAWAAKH